LPFSLAPHAATDSKAIPIMAFVTLRVLDGADRGRVFANIPTPLTIGREEGNTIQLRDERISRYHVKVQEDQDKLVLTDLESTNGTRVNGEDIQLRILRFGDLISVGRSLLLYGTREQIAGRLASLRLDGSDTGVVSPEEMARRIESATLDFELNWEDDADLQATLHMPSPPDLPERLSPGQAAQLTELLEYMHMRIRNLIGSVKIKASSDRITLESRQWQNLLDLHARLSEMLGAIADPPTPEEDDSPEL
jgi:pSer/pThr/pTyr-binding forkhead associated (FHA) protein